jgi:site-specific DNA-cytosine methylase
LIIDLCSGYGGATLESKDDVIRIDLNREVKPTIHADVRHLPLIPQLKPDKLWMSPPCTYLSHARPIRQGIRANLDVVGACLEAVHYLEPKLWILENPNGRLRYFLGPPTLSIRYKAYDLKNKSTDLWSNNKKSLKRAFIPKEVSEMIATL